MKRILLILAAQVIALLLCACSGSGQGSGTPSTACSTSDTKTEIAVTTEGTPAEEEITVMQLKIADTVVSVEWENNESVRALGTLCAAEPIEIEMSMYGGFEQVGAIGESLPRNDVQTMTEAGDIVLYSGDQIVIFYGSNSWAYTRLGRIVGMTKDELQRLLGNGDVTVTISAGA